MKVIGIGEKKTPNPFIAACDRFIYIEVIRSRYAEAKAAEKAEQRVQERKHKPQTQKTKREKLPDAVIKLIADSVADLTDDDNGVYMGVLGDLLCKKQPDFDMLRGLKVHIIIRLNFCEKTTGLWLLTFVRLFL